MRPPFGCLQGRSRGAYRHFCQNHSVLKAERKNKTKKNWFDSAFLLVLLVDLRLRITLFLSPIYFQDCPFFRKGSPLAFFIQWPLEWPQYEIFAILGPPRIFFALTTATIWCCGRKAFSSYSSIRRIVTSSSMQPTAVHSIEEAGIDLARWKGGFPTI